MITQLARANTLVMDEYAQIPLFIIDTVIRPMLNVKQDPWDTSGRKNHLVMSSTAYYQFNHLYDTYLDYIDKTDKNHEKFNDAYGLHMYTVDDMPEGWMDENVIQESKERMSEIEYNMEYKCIFPSDSDGFFTASLVRGAMKPAALIELEGSKGSQYAFGIDPARSGDNFSLVVTKLGNPSRVVACYALHQHTFPQMHDFIREKLRAYNSNGGEVVRIQMDNGGGGQTLKDYLAEEYAWFNQEDSKWKTMPAIIDFEDEDQQYMSGQRILKMQVFNAQSINTMNYDLRADFENGSLIIPSQPQTEQDDGMLYRRNFEEIEKMITEVMTIVPTPLKSGLLHFDTPKKRMKKDRYSALLLAAEGARDMQREIVGPPQPRLATGFRRSTFLTGRR